MDDTALDFMVEVEELLLLVIEETDFLAFLNGPKDLNESLFFGNGGLLVFFFL